MSPCQPKSYPLLQPTTVPNYGRRCRLEGRKPGRTGDMEDCPRGDTVLERRRRKNLDGNSPRQSLLKWSGTVCKSVRHTFVGSSGESHVGNFQGNYTTRRTFFLHFSFFPRELLGLFEDEKGHLKRRERDEKEVRRVGVSLRKGL